MKNLEATYEKSTGATNKAAAATTALMMIVSVTIVSLFSLSNIIIPNTAPQLVVADEAQSSVNNMKEINFSSPFSNFFNLGAPFLVEYDNTTSLKAIKNASPKSFDLTF